MPPGHGALFVVELQFPLPAVVIIAPFTPATKQIKSTTLNHIPRITKLDTPEYLKEFVPAFSCINSTLIFVSFFIKNILSPLKEFLSD